jgi:flagellar protein FliS
MTTTANYTARHYARVGLETDIAAADPHRMIMLLFCGALRAIGDAQRHLAARRIAAKGEAISRAISIVDQGLRRSLDRARGGDLAKQLDELYDYLNRRLLMASLHNDTAALAEVADLLGRLRGAWTEIGDSRAAPPLTFAPSDA